MFAFVLLLLATPCAEPAGDTAVSTLMLQVPRLETAPEDARTRYAKRLGLVILESGQLAAVTTNGVTTYDVVISREHDAALDQLNEFRFGRTDVALLPDEVAWKPGAKDYELENAFLAHALSELAYRDPILIQAQLEQWGFEQLAFIQGEDSDTQGFIASIGGTTFVVFRGSSSLTDFKTDARFSKTEAYGKSGRIHTGFDSAIDSIWGIAPQITEQQVKANGEVIFIGHSLGAALGSEGARRWEIDGHQAGAVYGFGSPNVGDSEFSATYDDLVGADTYIHINESDGVAKAPPTWLGFAEIGNRIHRRNGRTEFRAYNTQSRMAPEAASMTESPEAVHARVMAELEGRPPALAEGFQARGLFDAVSDHSIFEYGRWLEGALVKKRSR